MFPVERMEITAEQKELVANSYQETFDKEMAYTKIGLTSDQKETLNKDAEFQNRLAIFLIEEREKIIKTLRRHMDSDDDKISFTATTKIAEVLYPDFWKAKDRSGELTVNINAGNSPEEDERVKKEFEMAKGTKFDQ